tara:strand:+ start:862 stop:1170 length:309 start_codon:yes stop_codon:yes gene_type:complete
MCCSNCDKKKSFYTSFDDTLAYSEVDYDDYRIRTFSKDISEYLLKWHWDEEDRIITSLHNTDWKLQFDNELPQTLNEDIYISKDRYHRLIKGTNDLKIIIKK